MDDDGRQPIAISQLSYLGDLKITSILRIKWSLFVKHAVCQI